MYTLIKNIDNYSYKNISNLDSKRVVLRTCLNAPVDKTGRVIDTTRIDEAIEGIKYFAKNAKQLIIIGHLGRPKEYSKEESFWHIHEILEKEIQEEILFIQHNQEIILDKKIILIDNIRFFEEEDSEDDEVRENFAKRLASFGDVFVNDAFPDYRKSASTFDIAKFSREKYIGPKFLHEVISLNKLNESEKPFVAILGGAKLSEKLDTLSSLIDTADKILIGGAMAYTLMKASGIDIGNSLVEIEKLGVAKEILEKAGDKIILPVDHIVSDIFSEENALKTRSVTESNKIQNGKVGIDIGNDTIQIFKDEILKAKTIVWNGPMGVFEWDVSEKGTLEVGRAIGENKSAFKVAGGGDSIAAINKLQIEGLDHISTGGGAMLAFLAYNKFPTLDSIVGR